MNRRKLLLLPLLLVPGLATGTTVNYCHDPAVEREWSQLTDRYHSVPEWRELNRYRQRLCRRVDTGDLTVERAIDLFEAARTRKIEQLRKRLEKLRQSPAPAKHLG